VAWISKHRACFGHSSEDIFCFLSPHGVVLDLGCWDGRHSKYFIEQGLQVIGVDISIKHLIPKSRKGESILADGCRLPFKMKSFDCVLCSEVLEHLFSPDQCTREIHRVLKDDGIACLTTPCLEIPMKVLIPIYRKFAGIDPEKSMEHLHVFSSKKYLRCWSLCLK
jgi:SAM-dependent methyltransferase